MKEKNFIPPPVKKIQLLEDCPQAFKRILIMENDPESEAVLQNCLEARHYDVVFVKSAVQGLQEIREHDFDVIICNMIEPVFAGEMFYKAVERLKPHLCRRFVYMTGQCPNSASEAFLRKINGIKLWKPFEVHILLETVDVVLKKASGRTSLRMKSAVVPDVSKAPPLDGPKGCAPVREILALTGLMILSAQKSVRFATTNFSPNETLIEAFTEVAKRGIKVEIIVPTRTEAQIRNMVPPLIQQRFLDAGVALLESGGAMEAGSMMVIDGQCACATKGRSAFESLNVYHGNLVRQFLQLFEKTKTDARQVIRVEEDASWISGLTVKEENHSWTKKIPLFSWFFVSA